MGQPSSLGDVQIRLFGTLVVSRPGVSTVAIRSGPQRRLLSILALHVGDDVRSSLLEDCAGLSAGALRTSISRLRRVVGTDALETTPSGYRLRADVDIASFERMVKLVPELDDADALRVLAEAVALWRDDPLAEFADEPWTHAAIRRLAERHATAVEDLALLQLDACETSAAIVTLGAIIDREPFRERPRALLIRALAEDGRQTEALRAFQSYRSLLRDEIGIEPSLALVELDRAIAVSVETCTPIGPHPAHPAWVRERRVAPSAGISRRHQPPVPLSSFIGRDTDLTTVLELMATERLITLTGAGGCGKTRLAIAAATAAEHRGLSVVWVELGELSSPSHVAEHVAAAVGLTPRPNVDLVEQLVDHLASEPPTLLALDNAEHVLAAVDGLLTPLLLHCPALRALFSSREALGVPGELIWRVPSLATPPPDSPADVEVLMSYDSVRLFVERARSARPGLTTDAEALRHMASICAGVDGLPLAVELAAAQTRTQPVEVVAAGIHDALRWQAALRRAPLARHATLQASIQWSVDLVEPLARTILTRLSVFQSSFSFDAALAVAGDGEPPEDVVDAIAALIDANLLQLDDVAERLRMLHTVRRFCARRAQGGPEVDDARDRHARHVATYCQEIGEGHHGIERGSFIREAPDLVAAMDWARAREPRLVFAMCTGLASVRTVLGAHSNIADTWRWLLSLDRGPDTDEQWRQEWATAVAAQMAAATAHHIDVTSVAEELDLLLPVDALRARGWAGRGAAMRPAYEGRLGPILAYADEVRLRHDDLEYSVYGGFAAYMSALMGRLDETDHHVRGLSRVTRRHTTSFSVDAVGNGFAAAVIAELVRGDVRKAAARAIGPVPHDPAFSMTAAAALSHVALVTGDRHTLDRAIAWSRQRTIPLLRFLPTFIALVQRRFSGEVEHSADLAEQFWEEAERVPVSRLHPLPVLVTTLIEADRIGTAREMTDLAASIVGGMDPAPLLSAGVLASRALLDLHSGDVASAASALQALLGISMANGYVPLTVDALDHVAASTDDAFLAATLRATTNQWRKRIHGLPHLTAEGQDPARGTAPTLVDAVRLGQRWLEDAART